MGRVIWATYVFYGLDCSISKEEILEIYLQGVNQHESEKRVAYFEILASFTQYSLNAYL
jgi:hypothetical protein